jgi:hypothetical protein
MMIVEVYHAIVSTSYLSVTSMRPIFFVVAHPDVFAIIVCNNYLCLPMRPIAAGATDKTVLFHYNHMGTGLMSLKVLRIALGVPTRQSYQVVL